MSTAPAGWYPQPDGTQRYWDGGQWTQHFAQQFGVQPKGPSDGGSDGRDNSGERQEHRSKVVDETEPTKAGAPGRTPYVLLAAIALVVIGTAAFGLSRFGASKIPNDSRDAAEAVAAAAHLDLEGYEDAFAPWALFSPPFALTPEDIMSGPYLMNDEGGGYPATPGRRTDQPACAQQLKAGYHLHSQRHSY